MDRKLGILKALSIYSIVISLGSLARWVSFLSVSARRDYFLNNGTAMGVLFFTIIVAIVMLISSLGVWKLRNGGRLVLLVIYCITVSAQLVGELAFLNDHRTLPPITFWVVLGKIHLIISCLAVWVLSRRDTVRLFTKPE